MPYFNERIDVLPYSRHQQLQAAPVYQPIAKWHLVTHLQGLPPFVFLGTGTEPQVMTLLVNNKCCRAKQWQKSAILTCTIVSMLLEGSRYNISLCTRAMDNTMGPGETGRVQIITQEHTRRHQLPENILPYVRNDTMVSSISSFRYLLLNMALSVKAFYYISLHIFINFPGLAPRFKILGFTADFRSHPFLTRNTNLKS